jgi:hypothetical protein
MVLPGYCTHARGRSSRGALAHSRGTLWAVRALVALRRPAVFVAQPRRTRVRFAFVIGRPPICAAGVTWRRVIASAPWAARAYHTTVIDAAGAIYVLGGNSGTTFYKDFWVSTDGGADRTRGPNGRHPCGVPRADATVEGLRAVEHARCGWGGE